MLCRVTLVSLKKILTISATFSIFADHLPKYNYIDGIFRKIMVHTVGAKMQSVDFVKTGFTGQTHFTVIRYSATNNGLGSKSQFCFQANVLKVTIIHEKVPSR
jgi:hypothetical protein